MNSSYSPRRVVVVGGGVFGVSSALHLVRRGARVTLVTEGTTGTGASGRSLSWLNSSRLRSMPYHHLRMAGIDRYRTLASLRPDASWLRFDGGLTWDADDERNDIPAVCRHEWNIGYDARLLTADEAGAVTPGVNAAAITPQGAIFNPGEGWVDLPSLIQVLLAEFVGRGGVLVENSGRATVDVSGAAARGVTIRDGTGFAADAVLLAAGAATPDTLAEAGVRIPDATPISLLVRTRPVESRLRAVLNTPRVAVRPALDGSLVLDSAWAEEEVVTNADGSYAVDQGTVRRLLHEASSVLEGTPRLELENYGVGPKPIPADGEPVLGELSSISNYYVAFSHSGATLGLIVGELLADEIVTGHPHPMLASFRADRFK